MPKAAEKKATAATVLALKPRAARWVQLFDGGLGVRVFPTGTKTWIYWYRQDDRKRMLTLGSFPEMSLAEAQEARNDAAKLRRGGTDPATAKVAAKVRKRVVATAVAGEVVDPAKITLRQTFADWKLNELQPRVEPNGTKHGRKDGGKTLEQQFAKHIFPILGDLPLRDLTRGHVMPLLNRTKQRGAYRTTAVLLSSLRQMLDYAERLEYINANPVRALPVASVVGRPNKRDRVLDDAELRRFVQRIASVDLHVVTVLALRFVLATGQRPGEVSGMPKAELDKTGTLWTIPPERYKTGERQVVPISPYARSILAEAAKYNAGSDWVFPSPQSLERPIDRHSLSRAVLRKLGELEIAPFTPHDLRRTCRTGLAAMGVPDHVAERVIGHRFGSEMIGVYNHYAYLDERRAALAGWGKVLATLGSRKAKG